MLIPLSAGQCQTAQTKSIVYFDAADVPITPKSILL